MLTTKMFIYSGKISEPSTAINDKQNSFETWKRLLKTLFFLPSHYKAVLITRQKLVELFSFKDSVYWFLLCFSHYGVHFTQLIAGPCPKWCIFWWGHAVSWTSFKGISTKNENLLKIYSPPGHPRCRWVCFFLWRNLAL